MRAHHAHGLFLIPMAGRDLRLLLWQDNLKGPGPCMLNLPQKGDKQWILVRMLTRSTYFYKKIVRPAKWVLITKEVLKYQLKTKCTLWFLVVTCQFWLEWKFPSLTDRFIPWTLETSFVSNYKLHAEPLCPKCKIQVVKMKCKSNGLPLLAVPILIINQRWSN